MVLFDHEGSGQENRSAATVAEDLQKRLRRNGWNSRAIVIVIEPELENWVWSQSNDVANALGWDDIGNLSDWLRERNYWQEDVAKPDRPKEAMEAAIREKRIPWSASIFARIASKVDFRQCIDPAFLQLISFLRQNFPC
jgi:hypothetical protein